MKLKDVLATLDIEFDLADGDMITDVVVIAKVSTLEGGGASVVQAATEGTDSITKYGLVMAASTIIGSGWEEV